MSSIKYSTYSIGFIESSSSSCYFEFDQVVCYTKFKPKHKFNLEKNDFINHVKII